MTNSVQPKGGTFTVGDFMTKKEDLHVVKPTTTVDEALEALVEKRITGFPVIDDDWKLVGLVSDYDLLALDSISGAGQTDTNLFPDVDSSWKAFNKIQKLLSKTNGQVVGDLMTPAPLVVRETTNLEDAARLLLETKYRRLPVVDVDGKLVGIITRGNVVRAALKIKKTSEEGDGFGDIKSCMEALVEKRITGFPVIDDDWKLVGLVSDYDLLALDSISGAGQTDTNLFPDVDSSWKAFNKIQKLLSKTNGQVVGDLMTPAPLVVRETTNLEDAARLLLETKYRRLPVVDVDGKLVGIITRGNVVRAALR
ncbi:hypothetical protein L1049_015630 [Liquidambar formosana]|uniref:CBS domain-containing protein n=1 Tax=Liquidambar formosana TaxID=63359 RepID=A0AAP0RYD8_LIQFO